MAGKNLESTVITEPVFADGGMQWKYGGRIGRTTHKTEREKAGRLMPKWNPAYMPGQLRYWLRSYWNANEIALPEDFESMPLKQLYAIYRRIRK